MNKLILILSVLVFLENQTFAQTGNESVRYNKNGSLVWISLTNGAVLGKGYGYGVLTGVAVGSVGSLILDANEEQDPILAIPLGGFLGSGIGIIAGLLPDKTFVIKGDQQNWNSFFLDLDKRAFWRQKK